MTDFLTEEDHLPNLNNCTISGTVLKVEPIKGKAVGLSFVVTYTKHWPSGGVQDIPLRCYVSGAERIEKLAWLKPGEVVLVHGEVTDKGAVYAHRLEQLSKPEREPGEDAYLTGMQRTSMA